jgi:hypothetical protein
MQHPGASSARLPATSAHGLTDFTQELTVQAECFLATRWLAARRERAVLTLRRFRAQTGAIARPRLFIFAAGVVNA